MKWSEPMARPNHQLPPTNMSSRSKSPPKSGEGISGFIFITQWYHLLQIIYFFFIFAAIVQISSFLLKQMHINTGGFLFFLLWTQVQAPTPKHGLRCSRNLEKVWKSPTSLGAWCLWLSPKAWWTSQDKTAASSTAPFRWEEPPPSLKWSTDVDPNCSVCLVLGFFFFYWDAFWRFLLHIREEKKPFGSFLTGPLAAGHFQEKFEAPLRSLLSRWRLHFLRFKGWFFSHAWMWT